jgi:hypothetical protein
MVIKKKRIRNYAKYFGFLKEAQTFRLIVRVSDGKGVEDKIGFSGELVAGKTILPSSDFGPISHFNAEGKEVKRKDLPMETAHRTVEWHWEQWNGRYDTIERTEFVDVPYQRYPRDFIAPPSEEIELMLMGNELVFVSRVLTNTLSEEQDSLHVVSLFLEIFGQAEIVSRDLQSFHSPEQIRLNWRILPPGEYPWEKVSKKLNQIIATLPEGNRHWAQHRVEAIRKHKPDFHAIGAGGFYGYVVYGFSSLGLYVLETIRYGNATYVFKSDWKTLSRLTKAQVLDSGSDVRRIIHHPSWTNEIEELLTEEPIVPGDDGSVKSI